MTVSAINPYLPPPPAVGTSYGNIMDAFFSTLSDAEKQAIWVAFLTANNLTEPVPPGSEELFLTYIQQAIANEQLFVPSYTNAILSPDEIKKRNIMFGVFNSVINMLLTLQNTITVESENLAFFARWQKEYTNMLTRVPSYVGGENSNINVNLADLSKFTIGYDGISIEDIAKWWAQQRLEGNTKTFQISGFQQFIIYGLGTTSTPTYVNQATTITFGPTSIDFTTRYIQYFGAILVANSTSTIATTPVTQATTFDENVTNLETAFKQFWTSASPSMPAYSSQLNAQRNSLPNYAGVTQEDFVSQGLLMQSQIYSSATGYSDPYSVLSVMKPYTYVAPSAFTDAAFYLRALGDVNSKYRAEINSRDQQYIESIRSKRQVVQDVQSQIQANLDQSRQTLSQQTELLTSIMESLKGILTSIFR